MDYLVFFVSSNQCMSEDSLDVDRKCNLDKLVAVVCVTV
jgi:hypothetical protein